MQSNDLGTGCFLKMTNHRVAHHLIQLLQRIGSGKDQLAERLCRVSPLGRLRNQENDLVHLGLQKENRRPR